MRMKRASGRTDGLDAAARAAEDVDLTRAVARGEREARRRFVSRLLGPVRRSLSYLAASDADAEELAQVTLLKLIDAAGGFRGESGLERWAHRIAVRTAMRHREKRNRRRRLGEELFTPPPAARGIDEEADLGGVRRRVREILQTLPAEQRNALVLHLVEGYTAPEVAAISDVPLGTARDRLARGRARLRERILDDPVLGDWCAAREA